MKLSENTKVTLTLAQLKALLNESFDYYPCPRCGERVREDDLSLPGFLNDYFIDRQDLPVWREFIREHWDEIDRLDLDHGRFGILIQPVCARCVNEIAKSPKFERLNAKWERVKKESHSETVD